MALEIVLPDHRMEDDFCPPMPYTLGYSATSKSTDSFEYSLGWLRRVWWREDTLGDISS